MPTTLRLRIIYPSSVEREPILPQRISQLSCQGYQILYDDLPEVSSWPYVAASTEHRTQALVSALLEEGSDAIICARGGYGASDLLPDIPWRQLKSTRPKWFIGYSDITAIHCALFTQLGWRTCIHGPMPASELWGQNGEEDLTCLREIVTGVRRRGTIQINAVDVAGVSSQNTMGWLFGGNLSVLCNLIGTPYFPQSLSGALLFVEDIGENPGRLIRYWNQLIQCGALNGVRGAILGHFRDIGSKVSQVELKREFAKRVPFPVWSTEAFGHLSPNSPLVVGARGIVNPMGELTWET